MMSAILIIALSFAVLQINSVFCGEIILLATLALLSGAIFMSLAESGPSRLIAWVMVAVAIAALDFMAIRAVLVPQTSSLSHRERYLLATGCPADGERPGGRPAGRSTASRSPPVPPGV